MAGLVDNQTSCGVQLSITECSRDQPSTIEDVVLALCDNIYIIRWFSLRSSYIAQYTMHMHNSHANMYGEKSIHKIAQCLSLYCARCSHQYRRVAHSSTQQSSKPRSYSDPGIASLCTRSETLSSYSVSLWVNRIVISKNAQQCPSLVLQGQNITLTYLQLSLCLSLSAPSRRYLRRIRISSPDYQQWSAPPPSPTQNTKIQQPQHHMPSYSIYQLYLS